jgi:hypothetical protein
MESIGEHEWPFHPDRVHERPQLPTSGERHSIAWNPQPTSTGATWSCGSSPEAVTPGRMPGGRLT